MQTTQECMSKSGYKLSRVSIQVIVDTQSLGMRAVISSKYIHNLTQTTHILSTLYYPNNIKLQSDINFVVERSEN